ncbi:hypothetical protein GJ744_007553 [Endocarpon pusillum]|uniref:Uncharacterized protein n=1 Tax=Endocarpon pusillum TaxID=364733 RepID=A0A8H7E544_9EURO|nr:hypothetical protein GJ744_007553 [Endocarpon pusillum]
MTSGQKACTSLHNAQRQLEPLVQRTTRLAFEAAIKPTHNGGISAGGFNDQVEDLRVRDTRAYAIPYHFANPDTGRVGPPVSAEGHGDHGKEKG